MPLDAPEPDTAHLERSPLELVICQIRHEPKPAVADTSFAMGLHEALGGSSGRYPRVSLANSAELNVAMTPAGPQINERQNSGHEIASADQLWGVTFLPDHFALQTTAYETWADFRERLGDVVRVAAERLSPALMRRIGLRYVDRIKELSLDSVDAWKPYLAPSVLGLAADPRFEGTVVGAQAQYRLDLGDGIFANFTAQPVVGLDDGTVPFQLDYDVYVDEGRAFDVDGILEIAETLHTRARQLFALTITDDLLEHLK